MVTILMAFLGMRDCGVGAFLAQAPYSSQSGTVIVGDVRSSWVRAPSSNTPRFERQLARGPVSGLWRQGKTGSGSALSMVSATFGEKVNTDEIVLDKTAREALAERYPEALAENPGFLGEWSENYLVSVVYFGIAGHRC